MNLRAHSPLRSEHHLSSNINSRHTKTQVAEELERVGLIVEQIAHANIIPLPPVVDRWLVEVHSLETLPLQKGHLHYGLSVICVACKEPAIP